MPLALEHFQRSAASFQELDIRSLPGSLMNNMSGVYMILGNLEQAEKHSLAAVKNLQLTGRRLHESYALSRLSNVYRRSGALEDAENTQLRAMAVREELGDRRGVGSSLISMSAIAYDRGNLTRSLQYARMTGRCGSLLRNGR